VGLLYGKGSRNVKKPVREGAPCIFVYKMMETVVILEGVMNKVSKSAVSETFMDYTGSDLTHQIYYSIKQEILRGKLPVGEKLNAVHLAERYNVSRTPVTQALELLKRDNLVEQLPGRRATVKPLSAQEISDIYLFRKQLEPTVARLSIHVIPESELLMLKKHIAERQKHPEQRDESIQLDERIHSMLWRYLTDPMIHSIFRTINEYSVRLQAYTTYSIEGASSNCEEHMAIVDAVLSRDANIAAEAVMVHLERSCQRLLDLCEEK